MHLKGKIDLPSREFDVLIEEGLFERARSTLKELSSQGVILTTERIGALFPLGDDSCITVPCGEKSKSRAIKEKVEDSLLKMGCGKKSALLLIGGGSLLDLGGFVAATYCRGIPYLSLPTTLLAMTDAAIGGKTGVNVGEAKNWIGAFHLPQKIFIDPSLLATLSEEDFLYGLAETVKHALIYDASLFEFMENNCEAILRREKKPLKELIARSAQVKMTVVQRDPFEQKGERQILNFGHTVGHALEVLSNFSLPHGQAVLMGMVVEAKLASLKGFFPKEGVKRIEQFLKKFPFRFPYPNTLCFEQMKFDKKGAHRFIALKEIGEVFREGSEVTWTFSKQDFLEAWNDALCTFSVR